MRARATIVGILLLGTVLGSATPADAGWLHHTDERENGGRVLSAEASDLIRWSKAVGGYRRWATFVSARGRATVNPGTDHLCLRSTFVGVGKDVRAEVDTDQGHVAGDDRRAVVTFRSCGGHTRSIETQYPRVTFTAARLHRVDHILRVDASNADPAYVGSFTTRDSQLASQASGDGPPPAEECGV